MKKKLLIIVLLMMMLTLTSCKGCSNQYVEHPDGFNITIATDLREHFVYPDKVPVKHFDMDNVHVSTSSTKSSYALVSNDYYAVSDAWAAHLAQYKNRYAIIKETNQTNDEKTARFGNDKLPLDAKDENGNAQIYSKEYQIVAWDLDGTRYSYQFRTFVSNGKRYYAYCYSTNLSLCIEQPLMVTRINNENKLLLIPLPLDTKYEVSGSTLSMKALIDKETYLEEKYTKYSYPESLKGYTLSEKIAHIQAWYITYCSGEMIDEQFIVKYAGAKYEIRFNIERVDNDGKTVPAFQLIYLGSE